MRENKEIIEGSFGAEGTDSLCIVGPRLSDEAAMCSDAG